MTERLTAILIEFLDTGCIVKTVSVEGEGHQQFACSTLDAGKEMVIGLIDRRQVQSKIGQS